ncbi:tumor necrosis factor receptor superfamily member 4-like [Montipora capricornis]|uniref:tumor necrosis factor receptor superfamily member 4-like n=1 Tax=Montipora capricornis TaxID=246305 RepID=UPI0035F197A4
MAKTITIALVLYLSCFKALKACTEDQYTVAFENGKIVCVDCEACPPGHGLSSKCGTRISSKTKVICVPCQPGVSFSREFDKSSCQPCDSPCVEGQKIIQQCTPRANVLCEKYCNDYNRYYDDKRGCLPCSCCGENMDAVEDECQQKLGEKSNMICSFNSSTTGCNSTPSREVTEAPTDFQSHEDENDDGTVTTVPIAVLVPVGVVVVIIAVLLALYFWRRLKPAAPNTIKGGLALLTPSQKENSKLLKSLVDDEIAFEKICQALDTKITGGGNCKEVAGYYGFDSYFIKSRLEVSPGGPSRALIEYLVANYPDLTVQEFGNVIKERTKRNDVVVLLKKFDNADEYQVSLRMAGYCLPPNQGLKV